MFVDIDMILRHHFNGFRVHTMSLNSCAVDFCLVAGIMSQITFSYLTSATIACAEYEYVFHILFNLSRNCWISTDSRQFPLYNLPENPA